MYKISAFAAMCGVSAKLLRYYDSLGILTPAVVVPDTGYRFYTDEQVLLVKRIVVLKELGFTLRQIANLINNSLLVDEFRAMLIRRHSEVEQRIATEQRRLRHLEEQIAHVASGQSVFCPCLPTRHAEASTRAEVGERHQCAARSVRSLSCQPKGGT